MKQRIINGHALEFFDSSNTKKGEIKISGSDIIINPLDGNGTVIFGEQGTVNDIEVGAVGTPVDFTFAGGGTITSNGGTLTIGNTGDTIDLSNATIGAITASAFVGGTFEGDGAGLTGVVPDLSSYNGDVVVTGSLQVTGKVTAEEFHTEFVSASIVYQSGSTKFGDTADDVHQFTGSTHIQSGSYKIDTYGEGLRWYDGTNYNANRIQLSSAQNMQLQAGGVIQLQSPTQIVNGNELTFNNSGNTTRFDINNAGASGEYRLDFSSGSTQLMVISGSGNVGIGTTAPAEKLEVYSGNIKLNDGSRSLIIGEEGSSSHQIKSSGYLVVDATSGIQLNKTTNGNISILNGNVGIGTSSPISKLDVVGDARATNFQVDSGNRYKIGNGSQYITGTNDTAVEIYSGGSSRLYVSSSGNVGIGTTSPSDKLQVDGRVRIKSNSGLLIDTSDTYGASAAANFEVINDASSNSVLRILNSGNGGYRNISINTYGGKLGIGTLNPTETLTIEGNISASGNISTEGALLLDGVDGLHLNQGAASTFSPTPGIFYSGTSGQGWYFQVPNNGQEKFSFKLGSTAANREFRVVDPSWNPLFQVQGTGDAIIANNLTVGGIVTAKEFHTEFVSASIIYQSGSTKFGDTSDDVHQFTGSIYTSGSLEVNAGTSTPFIKGDAFRVARQVNGAFGKLTLGTISHLEGDIGNFTFRNGNDRLVFISGSGNVGIGTISPTKKLDVRGSAIISGSFSGTDANALVLNNTDSSGNPSIMRMIFSGEGGNEALQIGMYSSPTVKPVYFQSTQGSGWGNIVFQNNGGSVGIGTDSPSYKLQVNGTARFGDGSPYLKVTSTSVEVEGSYLFAAYQSGVSFYAYESVFRGLIKSDSSGGNALKLGDTVERMRIVDGNVGINTTSPTALLEIKGSGSVSTDTHFRVVEAAGTGNLFRVNQRETIARFLTGSDGILLLTNQAVNYGSSTVYTKRDSTLNAFVYSQGGTEHFAIKDGGNVGIGTTLPSEKLEVRDGYILVSGSSTSHGFELARDGNDTYQIRHLDGGLTIFNSTDARKEMTFKGDGYIGIGTTSPSSRLHVSGTADVLLIEGSGSTANTSIFAIDGNNGRLFEVSDDLSDSLFSVNTIAGLPVMEVFSDNRVTMGAFNQNDLVISGSKVGIGTDTVHPIAKMEVAGLTLPTIAFSGNSVRIGSQAGIGNTRIFANGGSLTYSTSNDVHKFVITGGGPEEVMRISATGNVGIGTTSPDSLLEIYSDSTTDFLKLTSGGTSASPIKLIFEKTTAEQGIIEYNRNGDLEIYNTDGDGGVMLNGRNSEAGDLYVADGGNVGIGTTSPSEKLQVNGNVAISGSNATLQLREGSAELYKLTAGGTSLDMTVDSTNAISIYQNGSVGIGTTSPSTKLHVATSTSGGNPSVIIQDNARGQTGTLNYVSFTEAAGSSQAKFGFQSTLNGTFTFANLIGDVDITSTGQVRAIASSNFIVQTAGNPHLIVNSSGDVGIGNTSPTEKLEVTGNIKATRVVSDILRDTNDNSHLQTTVTNASNTATVVGNSATANTLTLGVKSTGNVVVPSGSVGIGTTSPAHTLDVAQIADNQGIRLIGYDDQSSRTYLQYVDQNGHISLVASSGANLNYTVQNGHFNVNLNTSTKDFRVKDSGGSTVLNVTGDSKVGIGLTAPAETLHLSGSMRIDGAGTGTVQEQPGSPDTAYTNSSEANFYMGAPDRYLKIVLDGTTYLIPAYTPA